MTSESIGKFQKCVDNWNADPNIQFTVQLGDIIDGNETEELTEKDMADALNVIAQAKQPMHHVIGNHCLRYNGGKPRLMEKLQMPKGQSWYRIELNSDSVLKSGHVFLVLDGTDVMLNKWDPEHPKSKEAEAWLEKHPIDKFPNATTWNGAISSEQRSWFEAQLQQARATQSKVFVFCHYPILADHLVMAISLLWNATELVELVDQYSDVVVAWFSGHYHLGGAQMPTKERSWAHLTIPAILVAPEQSYAVLNVHENGVILQGTGSCPSYQWLFSTTKA